MTDLDDLVRRLRALSPLRGIMTTPTKPTGGIRLKSFVGRRATWNTE